MNLTITPSLLVALRRTVTEERLTNYLPASKGDLAVALMLYMANTRLCAAFYGPLQGLEVAVRNSVNSEMKRRYGNDWLTDRSAPLQPAQNAQIQEASAKLKEVGKAPDGNGDLVAELSFGFWVGLLGPKYENSLWRSTLRLAFPNRPKGYERKEIQKALNAVRRLRNRVAHHERILQRNLLDDHQLILDAASWICPETAKWISDNSGFDPRLIP